MFSEFLSLSAASRDKPQPIRSVGNTQNRLLATGAAAIVAGGLALACYAGTVVATTYPVPGTNDMITDGTFQPNTWFVGNSGVGSEQTTTPAGSQYAGELNISSSGYAGGSDLRSHASDPQNFKLSSNGSYVNVDGKTATISWDWEWSDLNTNNPLPAGAPPVGAYVQLRFFSLPPDSGQNEKGAFLVLQREICSRKMGALAEENM